LATINVDQVPPEHREPLYEEMARHNEVPFFKGTVEHAWSASVAPSTAACPRCHAPTQLQCANFIYSVQIGTRVMFSPAGFFCTRCPTVIVDDHLIAESVDPRFKFHGVVGIDAGDGKTPGFFRTWNGRKTVYMLDEEEGTIDLATREPATPAGAHPHGQKNSQAKKRKRQLAKQARRRNRRR
jgi:hypothetical protein